VGLVMVLNLWNLSLRNPFNLRTSYDSRAEEMVNTQNTLYEKNSR